MGKIPEKLMIIVNPSSGGGKSLDILPDIDRIVTDMGAKPDIRISKSPEDATQIALSAAGCSYDRVIVVGGDGSINMVASGIAGSKTVLGIIPAGIGNDFFRMLEIEGDLEYICKIAVKGDPIATDIGKINNKLFFNMAGIGFDSLIDESLKKQKNKLGLAAYLLAVYQHLKKYPCNEIKIRVDSYERDEDALMLAVGIGRSTGSGFRLTPSAKINDGKFDVCLIKYAKPLRITSMLHRIFKGTHVRIPEVEMYRCRQLEIYSSKPLPIQYEGETASDSIGKISIKMSRNKLQVAAGVQVNR